MHICHSVGFSATFQFGKSGNDNKHVHQPRKTTGTGRPVQINYNGSRVTSREQQPYKHFTAVHLITSTSQNLQTCDEIII